MWPYLQDILIHIANHHRMDYRLGLPVSWPHQVPDKFCGFWLLTKLMSYMFQDDHLQISSGASGLPHDEHHWVKTRNCSTLSDSHYVLCRDASRKFARRDINKRNTCQHVQRTRVHRLEWKDKAKRNVTKVE